MMAYLGLQVEGEVAPVVVVCDCVWGGCDVGCQQGMVLCGCVFGVVTVLCVIVMCVTFRRPETSSTLSPFSPVL